MSEAFLIFIIDFIATESFPEHIKGELDSILEREEYIRKLQEIEKSMCKVGTWSNKLINNNR